MQQEKRVISCYFMVNTNQIRRHSQAYVINPWSLPRVLVATKTRSKRWVRVWENVGKLGRFQFVIMRDVHTMFRHFNESGYMPEMNLLRNYQEREVSGLVHHEVAL